MKPMMKVLGVISGLLIAAGAVCVWHFWHIDGLIACLFSMSGILLVWHCIEAEDKDEDE